MKIILTPADLLPTQREKDAEEVTLSDFAKSGAFQHADTITFNPGKGKNRVLKSPTTATVA